MIEAVGLCKRFGGRSVLEGLTFTIPEGEIVALVGPNGSGKTTLLRILATLLAADEGDATIAGLSVREEPDAIKALIGYVPDSFGSYPGLTAEDYLIFHAGVHRLPRSSRPQLAGELMELVGLADRRHDDVEHLSRGQQQRLALARALLHDPRVLLVDDAAGLDPQARAEFRELVAELLRLGKTVLICSHHLAELEETCTWAGVLAEGAMTALGPIAEVVPGAAHARRIHVALVAGTDLGTVTALAEGFPGVVELSVGGDGFDLVVDHSFVEHELVARLVADGVKLRSFGAPAVGLGDAFLLARDELR